MLALLYDGTLNGDWISHYAVRLAQHRADRTLDVFHAEEGKLSPEALQERLQRLAERCALADVTLRATVLPPRGTVLETLAEQIPRGAESLVVCGTRARQSGSGFLAGTVSEKLLRARRWNVLALRVVRPGVLGRPRRLLLPVAGAPERLELGQPFLRLLIRDAAGVHVLWIRVVGRFAYRRLTFERAQALLQPGRAYVRSIEADFAALTEASPVRVDGESLVSDDVPKEIVICANRLKSDLIVMGASRRGFVERLLRGNPIEQALRDAPCDVAIYGGCA